MIEVKIINKIGEKIDEYIANYGSSKSWLAKQVGISRQSLNTIIKSQNPTIETLEKLAVLLNCDTNELYDKEIKRDGMIIKIQRFKEHISLK